MRRIFGAVLLCALGATATAARAQGAAGPLFARRSWRQVALGFAASIAAHESAHILTSYAVGAHPHFGVTKGRPTVYSGIDPNVDPDKQAKFSSAGLITQSVLDELLLDVPGATRSPFVRGMIVGGVATSLFYVTLGRNGAVSDVNLTAKYSSLSKDQVTLVVGGVALMHAARLSLRGHELRVAALPGRDGRIFVRGTISTP